MGGPYPTGDYEEALRDKNIDICMLGEGEVTLSDIVNKMINNNNCLPEKETLKNIPGIAFREDDNFARFQVYNQKDLKEKVA